MTVECHEIHGLLRFVFFVPEIHFFMFREFTNRYQLLIVINALFTFKIIDARIKDLLVFVLQIICS